MANFPLSRGYFPDFVLQLSGKVIHSLRRVYFLKKFDEYFGRFIINVLDTGFATRVITFPKSLLIIRPGGIGDAVLLVPFINAIRKQFSDINISVLAERRNYSVFDMCSDIDTVFQYDSPLQLFRVMCGHYDVVIDTEQWYRLSAVLARLVHAPVKIGYDTNNRRQMFTHLIPYSHDDYEAASFVRLLEPLGVDTSFTEMRGPFLSISEALSGKAAKLLESLHDEPFVVLFPGASIAERRWGAERFGQVAQRLSDRGYRIVIVGGREDRDDGGIIAGNAGLNLAGLTTLAETAAVIARATLVVSGDSGVLHLAVGLNVSSVSLFGSGIAAKWAPQGKNHIVLNHCLPCSPCTKFGTTPPCLINARCMSDITPEEVMSAIGRLLPQLPEKS